MSTVDPFSVDLVKKADEPEVVETPEIEEEEEEIVTSVDEALEQEEEEVEQPEGGSSAEEPQFEGRTGSSMLAESYKANGILPIDFEVKDDLSASELSEALYKEAHAKAIQDAELDLQSRGYDDKVFEYVEFLMNGGNPQSVQQHTIYDQLATFKPENDDDNRQLVQAMLRDQQMDEDLIEDTLETLEVKGVLEERAQQANKYFAQKRDRYFEEQKRVAEQQKQAYQQSLKQQEDTFRNIIRKQKVGKFDLNTAEAKELETAFLNKTEVVVQQAPDGTKQKVKVTKFEKLMNEVRQDPEKTLEFAYIILNGVDSIKTKTTSKVREEFLNALDAKTKIETVPKKKTKDKRQVFSDFAQSTTIQVKH